MSFVQIPASRIRILSFGAAAARRPAVTPAEVPPRVKVSLCHTRRMMGGTPDEYNIIFRVEGREYDHVVPLTHRRGDLVAQYSIVLHFILRPGVNSINAPRSDMLKV